MEAITGPSPSFSRYLSYLSHPAWQRVVAQALVDSPFCDRLLNGSRAKALTEGDFGLSAGELVFLLTIQADTLPEFAQAIGVGRRSRHSRHSLWLYHRQARERPVSHPLDTCSRQRPVTCTSTPKNCSTRPATSCQNWDTQSYYPQSHPYPCPQPRVREVGPLSEAIS